MGCNHYVGYWYPGDDLIQQDDLFLADWEDEGSIEFSYCPICGEKLLDWGNKVEGSC